MRVLGVLMCSLLAHALPINASHAECPESSPDSSNILCDPATPPVAAHPGLAGPGQSYSASGNFAASIQIYDLPIPLQYNSQDPVTSGPYGARMTFLGSLSVIDNSAGAVASDLLNPGEGSGSLLLIDGFGTRLRFAKNGDTWAHPHREQGDISFIQRNPSGSGYELVDSTRSKVTYDVEYAGTFYPSKFTAPSGIATSIEYQDGRPIKISVPEGKTWALTYNAEGRLAQVKDSFSRITTLEYGGNNLVAVRYPGEEGYILAYANATGVNAALLVGINLRQKYKNQDQNEPGMFSASSFVDYYNGGILARYEYRPDRLIGGGSILRTQYTYQRSSVLAEYGRMEDPPHGSSQDATFKSWRSWVDLYSPHPVLGMALVEQRAGNTPSEQNLGIRTAGYTWDPSGRLASLTDSMGVVTTYTYDQRGLIQAINSTGEIATQFRSRQSEFPYLPTEIVVSGANGIQTRHTFEYDNKANLTQAVIYDGSGAERSRLTYTHADGFPTRVQTRSTSTAQYDDTYPWRTVSTSGAQGAVNYEYDPLGVVKKISTALGATALRYDYGNSNPADPLIRTWVESPFMSREYSLGRLDADSNIQNASSAFRSSLPGGLKITRENQMKYSPWNQASSYTAKTILSQAQGTLSQINGESRGTGGVSRVYTTDLAPAS